jgi:hypothetical protein
MSFTTTPDYNAFIDRIALILEKSTLVMPASNGSTTEKDLARQIIKYEFPVPEQPPGGLGPPHIIVTKADNPILRRQKVGRDSLDEHGWEKWTLEFYIISVILEQSSYERSQEAMYTITEAIQTTLGKNRRLITPGGAGIDPMAYNLTTVDIPYRLDSSEALLLAHNVVVRIDVLVNLR